jgi:translation elongation factor P/translation initiation factor 5A
MYDIFSPNNKRYGKMADTSDFRNGLTINIRMTSFNSVEFQHVKPVKAVCQNYVKSLRTGKD